MSETNTAGAIVPASNPSPAAKPERQIRVVESEIALFDTGKFEHLYRIAKGMAACALIPEHLMGVREKHQFTPYSAEQIVGNCLLIANQASRWGVDPFSLAPESYVTRGKLGYQGKLIKAIVDARAGLVGGLKFRFNSKQGDDFAVVAYGCETDMPEESKPLIKALAESNDRSALSDLEDLGVKAVRLSVAQGKTDNDMWRKDPEQKLAYSASVRWARRHRPDIILGIKTDDDTDAEEARAIEPIPKAVLPAPKQPSAEPVAVTTDAAPQVIAPEKKTRLPRVTKAVTQPPVQEAPPKEAAEEPPAEPAQEAAPAAEHAAPQTVAEKVGAKLEASEFTEPELVYMAIQMNLCNTTAKAIGDLADDKLTAILEDWDTALETLAELRARKEGK